MDWKPNCPTIEMGTKNLTNDNLSPVTQNKVNKIKNKKSDSHKFEKLESMFPNFQPLYWQQKKGGGGFMLFPRLPKIEIQG